MIDVAQQIRESADTKMRCLMMAPAIEEAGGRIVDVLRRGGRLLICGNGGSAADAQHFAAELVGRFETERRGVPAQALTTDTSLLTALSNDHGYDQVFARQVAALGTSADLLLGISTSGDSPSVVNALETAGRTGLACIALVGRGGGRIAQMRDVTVVCAPSDRTCRIQEVHTMIIHIWAQMVDEAFTTA